MSPEKRKYRFIYFLLAGLSVAAAYYAIRSFRPPTKSARLSDSSSVAAPVIAPDDKVHAGYAGSAACRDCHAAAFAKWQNSNHGLAEREISKVKDHAAFEPRQTLIHGKEKTEVFVDADGLAKILARGRDQQEHAFTAVRVIGNNPLRQFLVPAPGGRMQAHDVALDPAKNEWFSVHGDDERGPGDWGHWTGQGMNWNSMCAACHNTRLRKNFEPKTNSYHTSMAEMSVGCEACHGPMKDHVEWQKKPPLSVHGKDPTLKPFSRDQATETCAACHARRAEITGDLVPGESFYDHFSLTVTDETETFYPDGQIHEENFEYTSFLSSRMHHAGVRCADCHDPHDNKPLAVGNQLCMNCHAGGSKFPAPVIDPVAHSHHGAESTGNQCVSCHMPTTTYMQRHPRHDHSFSIPDPQLTKDLNVPNACNRCHTDKDTEWAIAAKKRFYGEKPDRPSRTRALLIGSARRGEPAARAGLIGLLASAEIPAWKATACHLLTRWVLDPAASQALIQQLKHESPLVREAAVRTLGTVTRENIASLRPALQPLLEDPARSVRVATAWALCDTLDLDTRAGKELCHMLDLNADQPMGRMQLGQFAMMRGDNPAAIRQMRKAIELDPNSPPFHHDLAILLSTTGDLQGAANEMQEAVRLDPQNPEYQYSLALVWNELGFTAKSTAALEKTVKLDPGYARAWYNLGLALSGSNQPREAIAALRRGESADPGDASIPYARATIHARLGQKQEAMAAASRALQLRPDFAEAKQLLEALSR